MGYFRQIGRRAQGRHQRWLNWINQNGARAATPMLAIVVPMAIEATEIRRALRRVAAPGVMLHISGIGGERITAAIARVAELPRTDAVILAGFCGALYPVLNTGDIHIAQSFYCPGQPELIAADARMAAVMIDAAATSAGADCVAAAQTPSVTVSAIAQPAAKADLRRYGATVNMEDYWAARAAAAAGISFASVRAVLDTAGQSLPAYAGDAVDRPARIAAGIARHPGRLPELLRLRRQMRQARRSLTRCVLAAVSARQAATPPAVETPAAAEAMR